MAERYGPCDERQPRYNDCLYCALPVTDCNAFNTFINDINLGVSVIAPEISTYFGVGSAIGPPRSKVRVVEISFCNSDIGMSF